MALLASRVVRMNCMYQSPVSGLYALKTHHCHHKVQWRFIRQQQSDAKKKLIVKTEDKKFSELTLGEKVVRSGKDATYGAIVVAGIGITGVMFYMIGRELFSSESPSGVYSKALKLLKKNDQIYDTFGEPLKGYGELTKRGRRRHVSHIEWLDDAGKKHMRMKFYIEGPLGKGTVHLEVKENESRKLEYRYVFVEVDNSYRTIVIEDNR